MPYPIVDLHCDFLSYLALDPERTPFDRAARCALPQLREGGVALQTLAIFAPPIDRAVELGAAQARAFRRLLDEHHDQVSCVDSGEPLREPEDGRLSVIAAIENASAFCEETGRLARGLERFAEIESQVGRLLYVSLTWNAENRFGGGNNSRRGLKDDGRHLVDLLAEKGIAIDLAHASHWLAADILEHLDAQSLSVPVLVSHTGFRALRDSPRNVSDDIVREVIRRGGVIGQGFLRSFLEPDSAAGFLAGLRHVIALGGAGHCAFGADFFAEIDLPPEMAKAVPEGGLFMAGFEDASTYPRLLEFLYEEAEWSDGFLEDLAWRNAFAFIARVWRV